LADIRAEPNSAYDSDIAANTLEFLVQDIKNQGVDLVIFPGDMIATSYNPRDHDDELASWRR